MSRIPGGRPIIASKTTFDALAVDSGEESEEEEVSVVPPPESSSQPEAKPTKSAIKKALKLARIEKRQHQKALAKAQRGHSPMSESSAISSDVPSNPSVPAHASSEDAIGVDSASPAETSVPQPSLPDAPIESKTPPVHLNGGPVDSGIAPPSRLVAPVQKPPSHQPSVPPPAAPLPPGLGTAEEKRPAQPLRRTLAQPFEPKPPVQDAEKVKKRQSFITRTLWSFIMIGGFIGLLLLGHAYMILLVMLCQTLVYREVTALFSLKSTKPQSGDAEDMHGKDPWSKTLNWYFFAVTNYFLYGESIIYYFKHVVFADAQLLPFATNHRMISFILYTIGFMGFVMSLKKGYLKQQFGLFCWVHMSLLLIVVSSHFIVNDILEGLIWFWVPASLVICNDVFAYIWGITLGRTPLIKLSPKKTVEGFVGAFWSTMIFGVIWGTYFMRFNYMICPVHDLGVSAWSAVQCTPNPVFVWRDWEIWKPVAVFLSTLFGRSITTIPYAPYQFHLLVLSFFASLVAPFGGFFASGFKRAFDIKDFGHSIPGHGGMTDRMDCQFLMGVFTYVYYSSLIREHHVTVGSILQTIVSGLTLNEQLELIADLRRYLETQGIKVPS
ncbi:putative phosphatidate cytidylyltransferase [Hypsizygus marmoreus]|uniref:Phosphatidate cytidylyltransferase n=1 Tax=Hypsizygus marmoreus TaxID=39966 RepID=A0A369JU96_HYPMA|nr:putative phosphatidate cytidylyltransferase [Hypsizygus marmoreus]